MHVRGINFTHQVLPKTAQKPPSRVKVTPWYCVRKFNFINCYQHFYRQEFLWKLNFLRFMCTSALAVQLGDEWFSPCLWDTLRTWTPIIIASRTSSICRWATGSFVVRTNAFIADLGWLTKRHKLHLNWNGTPTHNTRKSFKTLASQVNHTRFNHVRRYFHISKRLGNFKSILLFNPIDMRIALVLGRPPFY